MSSIICLVNVTNKANIIYLFLIKCKWIICNILAIELYKIVDEFDIKVIP